MRPGTQARSLRPVILWQVVVSRGRRRYAGDAPLHLFQYNYNTFVEMETDRCAAADVYNYMLNDLRKQNASATK